MSDQYYNELTYARNTESREENIKTPKPPSKVKYGAMFLLSGIGDIVDLANLTGAGIAVSIIVDIIVGFLLFVIGWATNTKIKKMSNLSKDLAEKITSIQNRITSIRNTYATAIKTGRKLRMLRKPIRVVAKSLGKVRKVIFRNPLLKNVTAIILDFIPYLDLLPWRTVGVYLTYKDEKVTYQQAVKEMIPGYVAAKEEEAQEVENFNASEMERASEETA